MELFGHEGALSDEVIMNILLHVSTAQDFLSFAATCSRLSGLCLFEEDRYSFWRYFYARRFCLDQHELLLYLGDKLRSFYARYLQLKMPTQFINIHVINVIVKQINDNSQITTKTNPAGDTNSLLWP